MIFNKFMDSVKNPKIQVLSIMYNWEPDMILSFFIDSFKEDLFLEELKNGELK